jgi:peptidoglycan/LPS O-acetylase OafA/YrhL
MSSNRGLKWRSLKDDLLFAFNPIRNWQLLIKTDQTRRLALDGWRVFAMFWIVSKHSIDITSIWILLPNFKEMALQSASYKPFLLAEFGVDIFFVLSGFLIGGILIREKRKYGRIRIFRFYARRILRMVPIYYFIMILFVLIGALSGQKTWADRMIWPNFLYFNDFVPFKSQFMSLAWSLSIEEQFYILCPILVYFLVPSLKAVLKFCGFLVLAIIITHLVIVHVVDFKFYWISFARLDPLNYSRYFDLIYDKPYIRFSPLILGLLASYLNYFELDKKLFSSTYKAALSMAFALALIGFIFVNKHFNLSVTRSDMFFESVYREIFDVGFILLVFGTLHIPVLQRIFSAGIFYPLFQLSYGIYLVHRAVLYFVLLKIHKWHLMNYFVDYRHPSAWQFYWVGTVALVLSAIVVIPIYLFVECPFMNLRARWIPSEVGPVKAVSSQQIVY